MERKGDYITTLTGRQFYPLAPDPSQIDIRDIAWALSMQCRYAGHVRQFYSVAEHSVHVSLVCDPQDAFEGLLHDASEAFIQDIIKPVKIHLRDYAEIESLWERCIAEVFRLRTPLPESVKRADQSVFAAEVEQLRPKFHGSMMPTESAADVTVQCWEPQLACDQFMLRYLFLLKSRV